MPREAAAKLMLHSRTCRGVCSCRGAMRVVESIKAQGPSRAIPTHLEAFQEALAGPRRGLEVRKQGGAERRDGRKGAGGTAEEGVSDGKGPCIHVAVIREKV